MQKKTIIVICSVVGVVAVAGTVSALLSKSETKLPDPKVQKPEERTNFLASDEFKEMPMEKKKEYFKKIRESGESTFRRRDDNNVDDETRKKLRENVRPVFHAMMQERADKYAAAKPEERVQMLDEIIDGMQERMKQRAAEREQRGEADRPQMTEEEREKRRKEREAGREQRMVRRQTERYEETSPEDRAKSAQFRKDLMARMQERGITPSWRGRRGGGR